MKLKMIKIFQPIHLPNGKFERYAIAKDHKVELEFVNGLVIVTHLDTGKEVAFGLAQIEFMEAADGESFHNHGSNQQTNTKGSYKKKEATE